MRYQVDIGTMKITDTRAGKRERVRSTNKEGYVWESMKNFIKDIMEQKILEQVDDTVKLRGHN